MSLKLVHDGSVESLPVYNFRDIAGCARKFADQLEAGEQGPEVSRVIAILDTPEGIALCVWGEATIGYELLGILEAAKIHAHDANIIEE